MAFENGQQLASGLKNLENYEQNENNFNNGKQQQTQSSPIWLRCQ